MRTGCSWEGKLLWGKVIARGPRRSSTPEVSKRVECKSPSRGRGLIEERALAMKPTSRRLCCYQALGHHDNSQSRGGGGTSPPLFLYFRVEKSASQKVSDNNTYTPLGPKAGDFASPLRSAKAGKRSASSRAFCADHRGRAKTASGESAGASGALITTGKWGKG